MCSASDQRQPTASKQRACTRCARGKRACDGKRPNCGRCIQLSKKCHYGTRAISTMTSTLGSIGLTVSQDASYADPHQNHPLSFSARQQTAHLAISDENLGTSVIPSSMQGSEWKPSADAGAEQTKTRSLIQNCNLIARECLCDVRYTKNGQKYDLERVFIASLPLVSKRK
jgi:Fungal Zn(2)-Cys(6) binuclear cluster domain